MMYSVDDEPALIIDNGSGKIKAGFSGDHAPRSIFEPVIGTTINSLHGDATLGRCKFIGDEISSRTEVMEYTYPLENGIVSDWDAMEKVWHHVFYNEIRVAPEDHPILITEPASSPKPNREKTVEVLFEQFNSPAMYLAQQSFLALYSIGKTTGIVIDIGYGKSEVVPLYQGHLIPHAVRSSNITGKLLTHHLSSYLNNRGYSFHSQNELGIVRNIKERLCYVAENFETENNKAANTPDTEKVYKLPDGQKITVSTERFYVPEIMFQPSSFGVPSQGIHEITNESFSKLDEHILKEMLFNTVLIIGGGTMFPGFVDRFWIEMMKLRPSINIVAPPERKCSVWIGGSILTSLSDFQSRWLTRQDYDEHGSSIVYKRWPLGF